MELIGRLLRLAAAVWALWLAAPVQAQLLDELDLRREGADVVLVVRFVTGVQLLRSVVAVAGDESLVFYRVLPGAPGVEGSAATQRLGGRSTLAGSRGVPTVTVTDEPEAGRPGDERRLLVRFAEPVRHRIRAGRGDRQIEVLLPGLGAAAAPVAAAAELPSGAGRPPPAPIAGAARGSYRVTIATTEGDAGSAVPIPSALQHLNIFTTRRVEQGRVLQETHIGMLATRAEAEWVLSVARARFPGARITVPEAEVGATVPTPTTTIVIPSAPSPQPLRPVTPPTQPRVAGSAPAPEVATPPLAASAPAAAATASPGAPVAAAPASSAAASAAAASAPSGAAPATAARPAPSASAPAPAVAASAPAPSAIDATPAAPPAPAEVEARAAALLASARAALGAGQYDAAIDTLSTLLDLPPNSLSRTAQALIGEARLRAGDSGRARAEFEAFLRLYPQGPDADRARAALVELGAPAPAGAGAARAGDPRTITLTTGSVSLYYYGGQSKSRTQEFQDSAIGGLPQLISEATLSGTDQRQWVGSTDLNWRHRDTESDRRFVFRDTYTRDELRPEKSRNRLSALYYDHRSISDGWQVRLGRQSPWGGGVLGRFDGLWAGYSFAPRWKASVVGGEPADALLDTRRRFYGGAIEAEALTRHLGATLYGIQQTIDNQIDRRAVGSDLRYADGGLAGTAQLDYDVLLKGLNIASLQGSWQRPDNSVLTFLYDRRKQPLLALGNTLFFVDPNLAVRPTTLTELLATTSMEALRERARAITATSTQAALGYTMPLSRQWQAGADVRLSNTTAVASVPDILPTGLPSTGDIWSLGAQLIGTNVYSGRDTHVFIANVLRGPTFQGELLSYNNSSSLDADWQLEPSLKWYRQRDDPGTDSTRWAPGVRVTWRVVKQVALESEVSVESSKTSGPNRNESSTRTFYYLGGRFEF
ncbi:MAG: outer membrane protein assembly factor BamD [Rubrivivax sp.]|nr:outer membrane protein assembly factor BamD [Rubrivivax sp.]